MDKIRNWFVRTLIPLIKKETKVEIIKDEDKVTVNVMIAGRTVFYKIYDI